MGHSLEARKGVQSFTSSLPDAHSYKTAWKYHEQWVCCGVYKNVKIHKISLKTHRLDLKCILIKFHEDIPNGPKYYLDLGIKFTECDLCTCKVCSCYFQQFRRRFIFTTKIQYLTFDIALGVNFTRYVAQYLIYHVTYAPAKFDNATSKGLRGDALTSRYIIWPLISEWQPH